MTTVTISLPQSLREFVNEQVKTKGYGNVSEYIRSLLRDAQQSQEDKRLEELLLAGLSRGGRDIDVTKDFWRKLKAEAARLSAKQKKSA